MKERKENHTTASIQPAVAKEKEGKEEEVEGEPHNRIITTGRKEENEK